jgi:hypothetical protein
LKTRYNCDENVLKTKYNCDENVTHLVRRTL